MSGGNKTIQLSFGSKKISLTLPEKNFGGLYAPRMIESSRNISEVLENALAHPIESSSLEKAVKEKSVLVLLADATRDVPHRELIEALASHLTGARRTIFVVTTGSHNPAGEGNAEIQNMFTEVAQRTGLKNFHAEIHDCRKAKFIRLGETSLGTPIEVSAHTQDAEVFVVASDMKNHYFAGYSNALKDFLPGISSFRSIEANHSHALNSRATFGRHPLHPDPTRRDNPLANDMIEAYRLIVGKRPCLVLGTIANKNEIMWAAFGKLESIIPRGIKIIDQTMHYALPRFPYLVVSPGGYPNDESLYTAQRAIELTKNALADQGEILFLSECRNGISPSPAAMKNFYDLLTEDLDAILQKTRGHYHLYSHKAYKFAEVLKRMSRLWIHSSLEDEMVRKVHLIPQHDPQALIQKWCETTPEAKIAFFEGANKLAVINV